ncbi:MAG TPA: mechanosensitive ion channel domain-containing protein [Alphaproteobacteria bacterium]|nr:mechanosensitive ion channel domain-containing protein [Alphaproteobacteria bacterium]
MDAPAWTELSAWLELIWLTIKTDVLTWAAAAQLGAALVALVVACLIGIPLRRKLLAWRSDEALHAGLRRLARVTRAVSIPLLWLVLQWLAVAAAAGLDQPRRVLTIVVSLLTAWVIIRFASGLLTNPVVARLIALVAWTIAALSILGLLGPISSALDQAAFTLGLLRISALTITKGLITLGLLLWAAIALGKLLEGQVRSIESLTPSVQVLIVKLVKILLVTIAIVAGLSAVGIDLTAFAVFSGAIGVGIGFGLQKVVSNFVSGIILLLDRSIKPGDVIAIGETYGSINSLNARFASVITRDGTEHLIPNETLITEPVENWTFTDRQVRISLPFGVSYNADPRAAIAIAEAAGDSNERILAAPPPRCLLKGFGDSAVDLELRAWIRDPQNGVSNVKSELLLAIWDGLKEAGIEIPFPQRDLHIRSAVPVPVAGSQAEKKS